MADFMNFPTPRERVLKYGATTIGIIPEICLVSHFQVGTWQVLYRPMTTGNVKRWGLPLMIPNFSRLKNGIFAGKAHHLADPWLWAHFALDSHRPGRSTIANGVEKQRRDAAQLPLRIYLLGCHHCR